MISTLVQIVIDLNNIPKIELELLGGSRRYHFVNNDEDWVDTPGDQTPSVDHSDTDTSRCESGLRHQDDLAEITVYLDANDVQTSDDEEELSEEGTTPFELSDSEASHWYAMFPFVSLCRCS